MAFHAVTSYGGTESDHCIQLATGDTLTDVHELDDYWFIGRNERTNQTGAFPKHCVTSDGQDAIPLPGDVTRGPGTTEIYTTVDKQGRNGSPDKVLNTMQGSDGRDQEVRFSDVNLERSGSEHGEFTMSWQDSSFEDSCRSQQQNVYSKISPKSKTEKTKISKESDINEGQYHRLGVLKNLRASTEKLIYSSRDEQKRTKAILGALFGLAIGIVLFLLSVFSFDYSYVEAAIIMCIFTIFISLGLAFSVHCRCIVVLVFPSFFTGKGRALLLSMIFSLMLTHLLSNIVYNAKETGNSMACIVEIATNQSRQLQKQLAVPLHELSAYIEEQEREIREASHAIHSTFGQVRTALDEADKQVDETKRTLDVLRENCKNRVKEVRDTCTSNCPKILGSLCDGCNSIMETQTSCDGLHLTDNALTEAARNARMAIDESLKYFEVDVQIAGDFNGTANTTRSLTDMQKEVNDDIGNKAETVTFFAKVLKKILSLSLLLLFLQSFWYLRNYLAKDGYDNIYITKQFKQLDKNNRNKGHESVLPLKKNEEEKYVDTSSWKLYSCELSGLKIGFIIVGLHFTLFIFIFLFDISLWYILDLVKVYGDVDVEVKGEGKVFVNVEGSGPVADFYRIMIKGLNIDQNYTAEIDIGSCLPKPKAPAYDMFPVYIILYMITTCFVGLEGYGIRLRRKICAFFYPEQEMARLDYLHKKIRHKRVGFLKFLRQQILSSHKEAQVKEKLRLSTWLAARFPFIASLLPKKTNLECTSCEQSENSFNHIRVTKCTGSSGGVSCDAAYCQECWTMLGSVCPLCQTDEVLLRD